jgi:tRNA(Ile)-lysidine synthase
VARWPAFLDAIYAWLDERGLIVPGARWVVGVSGGPDSTLLAHTLSELAARRELDWTLHIAHLHHGLRGPDADADSDFVQALAQQLDLPFHCERIDVRAEVATEGGSTEEVARLRRYEFLERVALRTESGAVAVAHHADDNAETVLHRICRGTGLRGLAGMPDVRPIQPGSRILLVRPLLAQRREAIETACDELSIEARIDATNASSEFTRGRIRHTVLPMLRKTLNPGVSDALLPLAEQARQLGTYLEDAAARTFDSLLISADGRQIVLNTRALQTKQRIIQAEVVRHAVSLVLGRDQDLGFAHLEAALKLADEGESGKMLHLPGPVLVRKLYGRLEFSRLLVDQPAAVAPLEPVNVNCPGRTPLPGLSVTLVAEIVDVDPGRIEELKSRPHPLEEWLDLDAVRPPMCVRARRLGERFWPLGAPGSKSLNDFLGDEKIDPSLRARTGILCDQDGPIWVMPLRIDERVKLTPDTRRALLLRLVPP